MNKRFSTFLKRTGIVILALGIVYAILLGYANYKLRQAYAALEADGRPMRLEQIIPTPIPDTDNAALVYKAVVMELKAERSDDANMDLFTRLNQLGGEINNTNSPTYQKSLDAYRQLIKRKTVINALKELEDGSAKPGCRYISDYTFKNGPSLMFPSITDALGLTRLVTKTARLQSEDGDSEEAWKSVRVGLRISNALKNEPTLVAHLVHIMQCGLSISAIRRVCENSNVSTEVVFQVDGLLQTFDDPTCLIKTIDSERLLSGEQFFKMPLYQLLQMMKMAGAVQSIARIYLTLRAIFPPYKYLDHAAYLNVMYAADVNAGQVFSEADVGMWDTVEKQIPWYCFTARGIISTLPSTKKQTANMIANARITRAGLAVLLHRQEQGKYPENLAAVHMENLIDPFSGKALIYRVASNGFIIYSVGPNMRDDGGEPWATGCFEKWKEKDDIAWKYTEKPEVKTEAKKETVTGDF